MVYVITAAKREQHQNSALGIGFIRFFPAQYRYVI